MSGNTILFIIVSGIIALLVALFQYFHKSNRNKLNVFLALLRFFTIFSVLLLLVNPEIEKKTVFTEKPNLVVALDNTESVTHLQQEIPENEFLETIQSDPSLNDHFHVVYYKLGNGINPLDSITNTETETNIDKAFRELSQIYKNTVSPTLLVTDGNQTYGTDYQFSTQYYKQPIYPVILGDTITYSDLKIAQLNVNKYAYLKNRFPVETVVVYNGYESIATRFQVFQGNTIVFSENLTLSKTNNSKTINFTLPANSVGVQQYKAVISPLENEKNKINNSKNFAVEVIDQKQRIAIVSSFIHPDLGLFKKSIESNEQREASILKPHEVLSQMDAFQLIILYQPDQSFGQVYEAIEQANKNTFTIIGTKTNINFINSHTADFALESTGQTEEYQGALNANYDNFIVDDIDFENFPPLQSSYGNLTFKRNSDVLLYKKLRSAVTQQPLLFTFEKSGRREGILLGENIWQWRAYSYLENETFNTFDDFFGKIVQYLASNKSRNRLTVDYESFYNGNSHVLISAQYFNKNYEFDSRETLNIKVENKETNERREFPFLLKNNTYQVDLSGLKAGDYNFTVQAQQENISYSGSFTILDYNVEQQFLNADVTKLHQLAANSSGKSYFIANYQQIVDDLVNDDRFKPIQKSTVNKVPLIDYKYLLFLIVSLLAIEWFTRKYNGLI